MQQILDHAATAAQAHDHTTGSVPYAVVSEGVAHTQGDFKIPDPDPTPPKGKFKDAADTIIGLLK